MKQKSIIILLAVALALVSCGHDDSNGYVIKGSVKNCDEWANGGHIVLIMHDNGKRITDTAQVIKGHFTLTGHIDNPDFAGLTAVQSDKVRPKGRILFFLENQKYSIKIKDGIITGRTLNGGRGNELFKEMNEFQSKLDKKYSIESIDRQLQTTSTPAYRMEQLRIVRHEYDSVVKAYTDSIILANTPSYFSLYMTAQEIANGGNPDSIRQVLDIYLKDSRYKNDPRLENMIETLDEKRRP